MLLVTTVDGVVEFPFAVVSGVVGFSFESAILIVALSMLLVTTVDGVMGFPFVFGVDGFSFETAIFMLVLSSVLLSSVSVMGILLLPSTTIDCVVELRLFNDNNWLLTIERTLLKFCKNKM
jgi:hypothetical protein